MKSWVFVEIMCDAQMSVMTDDLLNGKENYISSLVRNTLCQ